MKPKTVNIEFRANGVANAKTTTVVEDKTNHLWIATSGDGVSRFDPRNNAWQTYTQVDGLVDTDIRSMIITAAGDFWFGSSQGASYYSPSSNTWRSYFIENGLPNNSVWSLLEDHLGRVWFGTNGGGLAIYTPKQEHWQTVNTATGLAGSVVNALLEDVDGNVWAGTNAGLNCFDEKTNSWTTYLESDGLANNQVKALAQDGNGHLWVGTVNGLSRYAPHQKQWKTYTSIDGLGSNYIQALSFNPQGGLWAGTQQGVSLYHSHADNWTTLTKQDGLSDNMVYGVFQDELLNLWVATWGGGVSLYNKTNNCWSVYTTPTEFADTYTLDVVSSGPNHVWIATWGAVSHYNQQNGKWLTLSSAEGLPNNNVQVLATCCPAEVWIGADGGLIRYELKTQHWQIYTQQDGLINDNVTSLLFIDSDCLLIGTAQGLCQYNPKNCKWTAYTQKEIKDQSINVLHTDRLGNLWIGTNNGLVVHWQDDTWKRFSTRDGLLSPQVNALSSDARANIWIGTAAGLNQYSQEKNHLQDWSKRNALLSKTINALLLDEQELWCACPNGLLCCLDLVKQDVNTLESFGTFDLTALALDANSNLWVTSQGGGVFWIFRHGNSAGYIQNFTAGSQKFSSQFQVFENKVALGRPQSFAVSEPESPLVDSNSVSIAHTPTLAKASQNDRDYVWAGSDENGLILANLGSMLETNATPSNNHNHKIEALPSRHIMALGGTSNGDVWVGTNLGATHVAFETGKADFDLAYPDIPCGPITSVAANDQDEVYFTFNRLNPTIFSNHEAMQTRKNTSIWRMAQGELAPLPVSPAAQSAFEHCVVFSTCWSNSSGLWVGTNLGMFNCSNPSSELTAVAGLPTDMQACHVVASSQDTIYALCIDELSNNTIYASNGGSIEKLHIDNLPARIAAIAIDSNDTLWLSIGSNLYTVKQN